MIQTRNLCKSFGLKRAVENVTLTIQRGEYAALLGVNGAGKTTLIRLLATLTRPTFGDIVVADADSRKNPQTIRRNIGVMSHAGFLYDDLTAEENLRFYGKMYDLRDLEERIAHLLHQVGLLSRRHDRVRSFSRGMQQRLSLARALLHDPPILLLDEPFAGLDVNAADMLKKLLDDLIAHNHTVLLAVHDIDYALEKTHRILILRDGKLIADEPAGSQNPDAIREALRV
jgi:heme exporter protein A